MELTRKSFMLGVLAGVAAVGAGCGDDTGTGATGGSGGSGGNGGSGGTGGTGATGAGGDGGEPAGGAPADGGGGSGGAPAGGGGAGEGGTGGGLPQEACTEAIVGNHGHVLEVSQADIDAAQDKTYDIQGGSAHTHSVTITAAQFTTLAGGGQVVVTSTNGGAHTHEVTIVCGNP